jgi:hypothetical protein
MRLGNFLGAQVALCRTSVAHAHGPGTVTAYSFTGLAAGNQLFVGTGCCLPYPLVAARITFREDCATPQLTTCQGYYHGESRTPYSRNRTLCKVRLSCARTVGHPLQCWCREVRDGRFWCGQSGRYAAAARLSRSRNLLLLPSQSQLLAKFRSPKAPRAIT